jgi:hypothetical protein
VFWQRQQQLQRRSLPRAVHVAPDVGAA